MPIAAAAALVLLVTGCSSRQAPIGLREDLARRIDGILQRPEFRGSTFGIEIRRLRDGALLYDHGAQRLLAPASTTKLVACASALRLLGPDFRFETRIVRTGSLDSGTISGDLVLVASGDPNLSQRVVPGDRLLFADNDHTYAGFLADPELVPGDPLKVLRNLAAQVKAAGITRVDGAVVVDDGLFQERDDSAPDLSAICVNDNRLDVTIWPAAAAGDLPRLQVQPAHPALAVENKALTVDPALAPQGPQLRLQWREKPGRFVLSGRIPVGAKPFLCVARFQDPALAAAQLLSGELAGQRIDIAGPPRSARQGPQAYEGLPRVAAHVSPPFSEAIKVILKVSHNLHADLLPPLVGAIHGDAGTNAAGFRIIRGLLEKEGLGTDQVLLQDGSGLGRADVLSARFLVDLLRRAAAWKEFPAFHDALPVGGVDGTLASRFRNPALRGRLRAKTGTLIFPGALNPGCLYVSKSLAGYLDPDAPQGPPAARLPGKNVIVFAIIIANTLSPSRREGAEALFRAQEDILKSVIDAAGGGGPGIQAER